MLRRLGRIALAIIVGLAAAWAAGLYAHRPLWQSDDGDQPVAIAFLTDGRTILSAHRTTGDQTQVRLVGRERDTGRRVSETVLRWPGEPGTRFRTGVLHDRFVFTSSMPVNDTDPLLYRLLEWPTGRVAAEWVSRADKSYSPIVKLAPGGNWAFVTDHARSDCSLVRTADATVAWRVPTRPGRTVAAAAFAPDGKRLALYWRSNDIPGGNSVLVVDTATGAEGREFAVPNAPWPPQLFWQGDRMYVTNHSGWTSFGTADDNWGEGRDEPHLRTANDQWIIVAYGPDCWIKFDVSSLNDWRASLYGRMQEWGIASFAPWRTDFEVIDPATGRSRGHLQLPAGFYQFSPEGRHLVTASSDGVFHMWATDGPSSGLWAAVSGVVAFVIALLVRRHRVIVPS